MMQRDLYALQYGATESTMNTLGEAVQRGSEHPNEMGRLARELAELVEARALLRTGMPPRQLDTT
jgi:hypothetical protein